jgi:hypothetical protein
MFIHFLKKWQTHQPLKMLKDIMEVAYKLNLVALLEGSKTYFDNEEVKHFRVIISYKNIEDYDSTFIIEIEGINKELTLENGYYKEYDWLAPGKELMSVAYIYKFRSITEDYKNNHKLFHIFSKFAYEYLKLNPDDLIGDDNRYWNLDFFENLSKKYNPDWV